MHKTVKFAIVTALVAAIGGVMIYKSVQTQHQTAEFADDSIIAKGRPVLLELGSHSCAPCRQMTPILAELNAEQHGFTVSFVDVWATPDKGRQYGIEAIPTQIFFDADGKELFRHTGFYPKEDILAKWKELAITLQTENP